MTAGRCAVASWNPAEFHHWYSQMPVDERKREGVGRPSTRPTEALYGMVDLLKVCACRAVGH
jgi:hypothetical protein